MPIQKNVTTTVSARWPVKGSTITIGEFIRIGEELAKANLDLSQPLHFEPAGINGAGRSEPAMIVLRPYDPDAPKAAQPK